MLLRREQDVPRYRVTAIVHSVYILQWNSGNFHHISPLTESDDSVAVHSSLMRENVKKLCGGGKATLLPRRSLRSISPATNTHGPLTITIAFPLLFPSPRPLLTLSPALRIRVPARRYVIHPIIPPADIMPARIRIRRHGRMTVRERGRGLLRRSHQRRRILPRRDIAVALFVEVMARMSPRLERRRRRGMRMMRAERAGRAGG